MDTRCLFRGLVSGILVTFCLETGSSADGWYAGRWDSSLTCYGNSLDSHPLTVVLRVEVVDKDTELPLSGVDVRLEGVFSQEVYQESWLFPKMYSKHIVDKEFELRACTEGDGVAVFALRWRKWYASHEPWDRTDDPFDEIEKVRQVSCRRDGYRYAVQPIVLGVARIFRSDPSSPW